MVPDAPPPVPGAPGAPPGRPWFVRGLLWWVLFVAVLVVAVHECS